MKDKDKNKDIIKNSYENNQKNKINNTNKKDVSAIKQCNKLE
jgi:hypothetical protein